MTLKTADLLTPALLLEVDKLDANLARMRNHLARWPEVALRPHLKTAKSVEIARRVHGEGTGPITVSTLREAETFFAAGFGDILYAVGITPDKLRRATDLVEAGADLTLILDSIEAARSLAMFKASHRHAPQALIEVDVDGHRSGVRPDDPELVEIGRTLHEHGLLAGVLTHAGESYSARTHDEIRAFARLERDGALEAAEVLRAAGLPCRRVSIGSSPTALFTEDLSGVTEVRAGVYMFQDLVQSGISVCSPGDIALSVLSSVIGHQARKGWIMVDAGWMALSRDRGTQAQAVDYGYGLVCDIEGNPISDLVISAANQEHGVISSRSGAAIDMAAFPIGRKLRILPNHACATSAQHDRYHVVRSDDVIGEWKRFGQW